jgi:hypothetical protein
VSADLWDASLRKNPQTQYIKKNLHEIIVPTSQTCKILPTFNKPTYAPCSLSTWSTHH